MPAVISIERIDETHLGTLPAKGHVLRPQPFRCGFDPQGTRWRYRAKGSGVLPTLARWLGVDPKPANGLSERSLGMAPTLNPRP
jgi:hypothetical protein